MKLPLALPLVLTLCLFPQAGFGLGFRLADQDPEATARGDAFAATADNPSAIYYNPAGITQLDGTRVLMGAYAVTIKERVDLNAAGNHSFTNTNSELQAAPQFYLTYKPEKYPVAFGLGVYAPFGFGIKYPDDTPFRTLALEGKLQYVTLNPVVAWKIFDKLSIAAGPTFNYANVTLGRGVIAPGDEFKFKGDNVAYGFNAGILWDPHPMHHFGLTYRSATSVDFTGHTTIHTDPFTIPTAAGPFTVAGINSRESSDARVRFPQSVALGYSFRPAEDWNFEFDIDWTDWHSLKTVTLRQSSGDIALPFNWQSSFFYEFGVTKKFSHGFHASAGYFYSENSVPNDSFDPTVPDTNRHIFSAGFGQRMNHLNWDLAYQYSHGPSRTVSQGTVADGTYRFDSHAITLSLGYNF